MWGVLICVGCVIITAYFRKAKNKKKLLSGLAEKADHGGIDSYH